MANPTLLPDALTKHHQFPGNFCAASGFECIAKLHGFVDKDKFPLQSDKGNEGLGFGDTQFLDQWCVCKSDHFDTPHAMALIEEQTNDGRFPLVALYEWDDQQKPLGWHIFLLLRHEGKLLLVDPGQCSIKADDKTILTDLLESNRANNPERKTLHVFWYQLKSTPVPNEQLMRDIEQRVQSRVGDLMTALSEESMRGKILILTTQIDNLLSEMLKRLLKPARQKEDELFRQMGPLNSFASHIAMAYRLGLICKDDADALDLLRKIRNDCAHLMPFSLEVEPHLGRFVEFTKLTCQKDHLFLCIAGLICPKTTEDWVIEVCIAHIIYMEATLEKLEQTPDRFFRPTNRDKQHP